MANNISYGNPGGDVYGLTSATVKTNLFGTDPKFVDAAHADFRLQSSSPAINAGTPRSQVTTDIAGGPRPQGNGYDIGAYEYGANPVPAPENVRVLSVR